MSAHDLDEAWVCVVAATVALVLIALDGYATARQVRDLDERVGRLERVMDDVDRVERRACVSQVFGLPRR